jgi:hypothetical protein
MMARTQVSLDSELHRRARQRAAELGISFAEYVRRVVHEDLGEPDRRASPSLVLNLGRSGGTDIARDKDALVRQAAEAEWHRETSGGE